MSLESTPLSDIVTIEEVLAQVRTMFAKKNGEYRNNEYWYNNFITSGPVLSKVSTPITYCMALAAKQDAAVWEHISRGDTSSALFEERILDGLVYRVIALALKQEGLI